MPQEVIMIEEISSQENNNDNIELRYADTQAFISLDGACVTTFKIANKNILYPDGIIKVDGQKNKRGGIPLLFPYSGFLEGFPQHGFARDLKWEEAPIDELIPSKTSLKLQDNPETRKIFPYNFELNLNIELGENSLLYVLDILNKDNKNMPVAPGFHPYFMVPRGKLGDIQTNIDNFDFKNYRLEELKGSLFFPLKDLEVSIPGTGNLKMEYDGAFKRESSRLVIWTDKDNNKDDSYICLEPWATDLGGFLKKDQQLLVSPGQKASFSMRITLS